MKKGDLTRGPVMKTMLLFAVPMIISNLAAAVLQHGGPTKQRGIFHP